MGMVIGAAAGIAYGASSIITAHPARADNVTVAFNPNGVAFAYTDGYWDHDHHWHAWRKHADREAYIKDHHDHYYAWKHDRDKDMGWHEEH
jgi:hypothetical protein